MNFQVIVLFLYCALQVETNELDILKLPGCVFSEMDYKNIVYNCPKSTEPNFFFKREHETLFIKCENEYRLESLHVQNSSIFNSFQTFRIRGCELGMTEFGNQINLSEPHRENLNFGSLDLPTKITAVELADVGLFRLPEYLFKNRNDLTDVVFHTNKYNIKLPSGLFSNLPKL